MDRFDRNIRFFGTEGQAKLRNAHVAVIGCGGLGQHVIQQLAFLGIGKLTLIEHQSTQGKTPRHFAIDPTGQWLLAENQGSNTIVIFSIDPNTGRLQSTRKPVEIGSPVCVQFVTGQ